MPGILVGLAAGAWFMGQYSNDTFALTFAMRPISVAVCALVILGVAVLSLVPAIRTVRRLDIAEVVRERSA